MTLDPAIRLAALHSPDADEAIALRLPREEIGSGGDAKTLVEDAVEALVEMIEASLCLGHEELVLNLDAAELIAIALKTRRRPPGRPRQSKDDRVRRAALVSYAHQLKSELRKEGVGAGEAERQAASIAAGVGGRHGDIGSAATLQKLMKSGVKKPT